MDNIFDYTLQELSDEFEALGDKRYRGIQIFTWLYKKRVKTFKEMSDVSKKFIEILESRFVIEFPSISLQQISEDGTIKVLFSLKDNNKVEAVIMKYPHGNVLCISSQIGCNMGCSFCASGLLKKKRNLETNEMVSQILVLEETFNLKISNIVVMGTGEPFDNYQNVLNFVKIANEQKAFEIGARHITISTCGLVDKIKEFADFDLQVNLAVSLHAPNDVLRNTLMPINKSYPLKDLMASLHYYQNRTQRRLTFEYIMLKDINDSLKEADELIKLIKNTLSYVNLIPFNEVKELDYKRSKNISNFAKRLAEAGINVTIRKEFGKDILAACGQLRAKEGLK
ncbi:MAG: 23S rRNA (adenine(2503)-C(2))-methyltransferase RlmN [Bacillales bacterium]|jgi:23S rRNA (adenine2503-C2)-methyltransferase|nr:23S rRNA (adenine(2503)-C(2))-methyltransferase RlmN [Bacillales bacterium]